jgi:hypothetical protein
LAPASGWSGWGKTTCTLGMMIGTVSTCRGGGDVSSVGLSSDVGSCCALDHGVSLILWCVIFGCPCDTQQWWWVPKAVVSSAMVTTMTRASGQSATCVGLSPPHLVACRFDLLIKRVYEVLYASQCADVVVKST